MDNIEAARILAALLKQQEGLHPKHRDLDNRELLALGKAIKALRLAQSRKKQMED